MIPHKEMVEALCDHSPLTDWEADFVNDMAKQAERGAPFTDRQANRIAKIYHVRIVRGDQPWEGRA